MNIKLLMASGAGVALLGVGVLAGSVLGTGHAAAQTPGATVRAAIAQVAPAEQNAGVVRLISVAAQATAVPAAPKSPSTGAQGSTTATITQQQAEQAALAASPGSTVDHTRLFDQNGTAAYDVDFTNGGGAIVDATTDKVLTTEAAGQDHGGPGGHGGPGPDQAALAAQAKVTQQQAEQAALAASPGNTVDHTRLFDQNGTVAYDVDFTNGGGAVVDATTGKVLTSEAAGTDHGGRPGNGPTTRP